MISWRNKKTKNKETLFIYLFIFKAAKSRACESRREFFTPLWTSDLFCQMNIDHMVRKQPDDKSSVHNVLNSLPRRKKKNKRKVRGFNQQGGTFLDSLPAECDRYLPHGRAHSNPLGLLTCAHQCSHADQPLIIWKVQKTNNKKETRFHFGWKWSIR